jgi:hypothetical protein
VLCRSRNLGQNQTAVPPRYDVASAGDVDLGSEATSINTASLVNLEQLGMQSPAV